MAIKEISDKMLKRIYKLYISEIEIDCMSITESFDEISSGEFKVALIYLREKGYINFVWMFGSIHTYRRLVFKFVTPKGIDYVENGCKE